MINNVCASLNSIDPRNQKSAFECSMFIIRAQLLCEKKRQGWEWYEAPAGPMVFRPAEADSGKPHARAVAGALRAPAIKPRPRPAEFKRTARCPPGENACERAFLAMFAGMFEPVRAGALMFKFPGEFFYSTTIRLHPRMSLLSKRPKTSKCPEDVVFPRSLVMRKEQEWRLDRSMMLIPPVLPGVR